MTTLAEQAGASLFDGTATTPFLVLKGSALENNLAEMRDFCERNGVALAPHCKTHMSPELWRRQQRFGAVAATVATVAQARAFFAEGVRRILIANEVVDVAGLRAIAGMRRDDPALDLSILIDSIDGVDLTAGVFGDEFADLPPLPVFVEIGAPGRRSGCRTVDEVLTVARAAAASGVLELVGIEGYEGVFGTGSPDERTTSVEGFLDTGIDALRALLDAQLLTTPTTASFGGSRFYPTVIERIREAFPPDQVRIVLRSGCYLTHDHGTYAESHAQIPSTLGKPDLHPVIEVWATVLSTPEARLAIVGLGKRDASSDEGLPVPIARRRNGKTVPLTGATVRKLNDQHAFVDLEDEATGLRVGDLVAFGISHPCTTFDKWRSAAIVDDDYIAQELVTTMFH